MPEKEEIKKTLDSLLGKEFTAEQLQTLQLFFKVATWNRIDEAFVTQRSLILPRTFCNPWKLLDVSGVAGTGTTGTVKFRLKDFICLSEISFDNPINVVARPLGARPAFLTLKHTLVMNTAGTFATDVEIEVFTWDAKGAPLPQIAFDWRCRVPFEETIF